MTKYHTPLLIPITCYMIYHITYFMSYTCIYARICQVLPVRDLMRSYHEILSKNYCFTKFFVFTLYYIK